MSSEVTAICPRYSFNFRIAMLIQNVRYGIVIYEPAEIFQIQSRRHFSIVIASFVINRLHK